ncbi:MAG TPA: hypothetical protein VKY37_06425 [Brumimicrobium sp.]|nr:hypothetical protein [Brumimicrobium sp.]
MEKSEKGMTPNSFMRDLNRIYLIMLVEMMLFGSIALFTTISWNFDLPSTEDTFLIAVPLLTFIGVVLGRVLYKKKLDTLINEPSLKNKLTGYRVAIITKFALANAPFLIAVVAVLLTSNIFYLMIAGTLVMYFITLKPTLSKVKRDLGLSVKMGLQLNDKNQLIN